MVKGGRTSQQLHDESFMDRWERLLKDMLERQVNLEKWECVPRDMFLQIIILEPQVCDFLLAGSIVGLGQFL